jgi:hypothetical protein
MASSECFKGSHAVRFNVYPPKMLRKTFKLMGLWFQIRMHSESAARGITVVVLVRGVIFEVVLSERNNKFILTYCFFQSLLHFSSYRLYQFIPAISWLRNYAGSCTQFRKNPKQLLRAIMQPNAVLIRAFYMSTRMFIFNTHDVRTCLSRSRIDLRQLAG